MLANLSAPEGTDVTVCCVPPCTFKWRSMADQYDSSGEATLVQYDLSGIGSARSKRIIHTAIDKARVSGQSVQNTIKPLTTPASKPLWTASLE